MVTRWLGDVGKDKLGRWNGHTHTTVYEIDNQQAPTVYHSELYSIVCNNLYGKEYKKRVDICVCIIDPLCCTPGTNTIL